MLLEQNNISCNVISLHTIRPLDENAIKKAAANSDLLITVEEHSVNGGIGSRIASLLMEERIFVPMKIIGLPDEHTVTGSQVEIFEHYGISPQSLADTAKEMLEVLEK
jgi:transketolase